MIWRPVMQGKVTVGEIRRKEVFLEDCIILCQLMDAQAAAEQAAYDKQGK